MDTRATPPHDAEAAGAQGASLQLSVTPSTTGAHGAHSPPMPASSAAGQRSQTHPTPRSAEQQTPARLLS